MKKFIILFILALSFSSLFSEYSIKELKKMFQEKGYSENDQIFLIGYYFYAEGFLNKAINYYKNIKLPEEYNCDLQFTISQIYLDLDLVDLAYEHINKISKCNQEPSYKATQLYIKHLLGKNIEYEKKKLLATWKISNTLEQYALCEFLLKIEDYKTALEKVKDYDVMLKKDNLTNTNLQYIFYAHAYYGLGKYREAKTYIEKAKKIDMSKESLSYIYFWESIINYQLGNKEEAYKSFLMGEKNRDYHDRFMLLSFWHFSKANIKKLKEIEKTK